MDAALMCAYYEPLSFETVPDPAPDLSVLKLELPNSAGNTANFLTGS